MERLNGDFSIHLPGSKPLYLPGFPGELQIPFLSNRQSNASVPRCGEPSVSHSSRGPHSSPGPLLRERGVSASRERPSLSHFNRETEHSTEANIPGTTQVVEGRIRHLSGDR